MRMSPAALNDGGRREAGDGRLQARDAREETVTHSIPKVAQLVARACATTIRNDASTSHRQWEKAADCWRAQMRLGAPPRSDAALVSTPSGLRLAVRVVDGGQGGAFG